MADTLTALAWAAGRAGMSYGKYTANMTPRDVDRDVRAYRKWKEARRREAAKAAGLCRGDA